VNATTTKYKGVEWIHLAIGKIQWQDIVCGNETLGFIEGNKFQD
jgi:hypothetical protein